MTRAFACSCRNWFFLVKYGKFPESWKIQININKQIVTKIFSIPHEKFRFFLAILALRGSTHCLIQIKSNLCNQHDSYHFTLTKYQMAERVKVTTQSPVNMTFFLLYKMFGQINISFYQSSKKFL